MNARLKSIASKKRAGTDKPAWQFNQGRKWYNPPRNPQGDKANIGNCYGCGEPGHYKRNCPKLRARTNSQVTSVPKRQQPLELILRLIIKGITIPKEMRAAE